MAERRENRESAAETGRVVDPLLDLPRRTSAGSRLTLAQDLRPFQRLVANPFLAVAACAGWLVAMIAATRAGNVAFFLGALVCGPVVLLLPQYHCLDCGRTGHLSRSDRHACDRVRARVEAARPRRWRGPALGAQLILWAFAAALGWLFTAALGWAVIGLAMPPWRVLS